LGIIAIQIYSTSAEKEHDKFYNLEVQKMLISAFY